MIWSNVCSISFEIHNPDESIPEILAAGPCADLIVVPFIVGRDRDWIARNDLRVAILVAVDLFGPFETIDVLLDAINYCWRYIRGEVGLG